MAKTTTRCPFHPLEMAEDALLALFGFVFESPPGQYDVDAEEIPLVGYAIDRPGTTQH